MLMTLWSYIAPYPARFLSYVSGLIELAHHLLQFSYPASVGCIFLLQYSAVCCLSTQPVEISTTIKELTYNKCTFAAAKVISEIEAWYGNLIYFKKIP